MRMPSVTDRLQTILETDWKSEAARLLARRKATGEGPVCPPCRYCYINLLKHLVAFCTLILYSDLYDQQIVGNILTYTDSY
jgi:hypothetical protein